MKQFKNEAELAAWVKANNITLSSGGDLAAKGNLGDVFNFTATGNIRVNVTKATKDKPKDEKEYYVYYEYKDEKGNLHYSLSKVPAGGKVVATIVETFSEKDKRNYITYSFESIQTDEKLRGELVTEETTK